LESSGQPLVWFIDEADRLFASPFVSEFYGLIRSWHNSRASDRRGPWRRLTVVIGYATEAHLFIKDLNQSPFNVGYPVPMRKFSLDDTRDLNARYGAPRSKHEDVRELFGLVAGQPFLARRPFDVLAQGQLSFRELLVQAPREDGPFGDHLKRVLVSVSQLPSVWQALRDSFWSPNISDTEGIQRLVAASILLAAPSGGYELASELYLRYLSRYIMEIGAVEGGTP
jgi:hypothetical protein